MLLSAEHASGKMIVQRSLCRGKFKIIHACRIGGEFNHVGTLKLTPLESTPMIAANSLKVSLPLKVLKSGRFCQVLRDVQRDLEIPPARLPSPQDSPGSC